jgi:hypothetical protein
LAQPQPDPGHVAPWLRPEQLQPQTAQTPPVPAAAAAPAPAQPTFPPPYGAPPAPEPVFQPFSAAPAPPAPPQPAAPPAAPGWGIREQVQASPPSPGWGVREQTPPAAPPVWAATPTPAYAPTAAMPYAGAPPLGAPPIRTKPARGRGRLYARLGAGGVGIALLIIKVVLLTGGAKFAITATTKTYHAPPTIGGIAQSTDPTVTSALNQMQQSIQMPALQNGHTEGAAYGNASGMAYALVFGQDNAGSDVARPGFGLTDAFTPSQLSGTVTQQSNGINVSCATDTAGASPFQACSWYNDNAAGFFVDNVDTTPTSAASTLTSTLNAMV